MYPQILYWKWNDEILDRQVMLDKANDIIKRSNFRDIAVSPHSMKKPEASFRHPKMHALIKELNEFFTKNGRHLIMDVDMKMFYEQSLFFEKAPDKYAWQARLYEADLDSEGNADVFIAELNKAMLSMQAYSFSQSNTLEAKIVGAWSVIADDQLWFEEGSARDLSDKCELYTEGDSLYLRVRAGKENGGRRLVTYVNRKTSTPDRMSDEYIEAQLELMDSLADIPLYGMTTDEWGLVKIMEDGAAVSLYITDASVQKYREHTGRDLCADLLYFHYSEKNHADKSIQVVNGYIETLRKHVTRGDHMIYDKIKQLYGKDGFVGFHPTWYCAPTGFALEVSHNGMDWWEAKRDYAQTDERVPIAIRLAMSRSGNKPVWYNMWYSQRTMDIRTYYKESWVNARFGGRTDYLGYECYEPGVVYTFREEGRLELVSDMDDRIVPLNDFQTTLPNSRVLCLFGMETFTNPQLSAHGNKTFRAGMKGHAEILKISNGMFAANMLHDLVPSSEIDRDKLRIENGKIKYYEHDYDAVVVVAPNGMTAKAIDFVKACATVTDKVLCVGECKVLHDGEAYEGTITDADKCYPINANPKAIAERLLGMGIPANMGENYSVFEDGSVIFTTDGAENLGNPLTVSYELDGHKVEFEGEDMLAIRIKDGKPEFRYGAATKLTLDGKSLI